MVSDLLQLPLILGTIVSLISFWKTDRWRIASRSLGATIFWAVAYGMLYLSGSWGSGFVAQQIAVLGPRFVAFVLFLEGWGLLTKIWLSSTVVSATLRFTKTRASLPRDIGEIIDGLAFWGVVLLFLGFMSGTIPSG